ncbi:ArsR family transcriptional regulator [Haloferax elongans ATCC BAA-1513]|uniref:ArsR family transcriptional regulator n=1 Tax=Haloferax elongans ATCC BAA-1513 TaxID=1230453 RepID=M0HV39_HALEO|nr:helix-turn-helix domain-containing protein [Haloferax elongans]ELZ87618.1 ArsR family transcriptional regulator [Haloferax elongans ATCC BAA-1513]
MSQATLPPSVRSHTSGSPSEVVDDQETIDVLFETLDDPDCRRILDVTEGNPMSASELAEACELPLSTTYRKLDRLTDSDLVSKELRICRSGKHTSEYERAIDDVTVSVSPSGLEVRLSFVDN